MDHDHHDELDFLEIDLDLGDLGLPPIEADEPDPGRGPVPARAAADPELPWLTPVIVACMCGFGALSMAIVTSGGSGGAGVAWLLGGAFAVLYVIVFWAGSALIARHRYR